MDARAQLVPETSPTHGPVLPWAIFNKHDALIFLALARTEDTVWCWHLGWPAREEVDAAKAKGLRCVRVTVAEKR